MTIVYRTAGDWGSGKGSNLTPAEVDENFWDLAARVLALETDAPQPNEISNITQSGDTITVHMEDGSTFGPFDLPRPVLRPTISLAVPDATLTPTASQTGYYFRCSSASGCVVTVPTNTAQAFLTDAELHFRQGGAGAISFEPASGSVVINDIDGYLKQTAAQGAVVTLKKVGTNEWDLFGMLAEETTGSTAT